MWGAGSVIRGSGSQIRGAGSEIRRDPPQFNPCSVVQWAQCVRGRFSLRFWFRAIQSNGLAVSLLSSDVAASQYLVVYLRAGHIVVSMASTSRRSTRLTSRDTYDDANWWQVASSSSSSSHTHTHTSIIAAVPPRPQDGTACFSHRTLHPSVRLCDRL